MLPEVCAVCGHPPRDHMPREWNVRVNVCQGAPAPASDLLRCACEGYQPSTYQGYTVEDALEDAEIPADA